MGLLARNTGSLFGLDIGTTAVKLVELSRFGEGYRVEACGVEPLPTHAVAGDNISDAEAVGEAVSRLVARSAPKSRTAAVAVAGSSAIVTTVDVDASLTDDEMELEIAVEAGPRIPYPVEEAALDFEPRNLKADNPAQLEVVVAACRMEQVHSRETALAGAGLRVAIVDIETFCLQRALEAQCAGGTPAHVALADIGATTTKLLALRDGGAVFAREEAFDGARWQRERLADQAAGEALFQEDLLRQLARMLRLYAAAGSRGAAASIGQLLLAGGVAASTDLAALASERLGVAAAVADPFAGMALAPRLDDEHVRRHAPSLMTACGLALRRFEP